MFENDVKGDSLSYIAIHYNYLNTHSITKNKKVSLLQATYKFYKPPRLYIFPSKNSGSLQNKIVFKEENSDTYKENIKLVRDSN